MLRGGDPLGTGQAQAIPLFHANPDIVFAGKHPAPRLACGSFVTCLEHLFGVVTGGARLSVTRVGKPLRVTYDYARYLLARRRDHLATLSSSDAADDTDFVPVIPPLGIQAHPRVAHVSTEIEDPPFSKLFMVGDNPAADIRGANTAGAPWVSVLVRTGVFRGPHANDLSDPAHVVVDDISRAVDWILNGQSSGR